MKGWEQAMSVDLHRIPNVCLSTADVRQKTLIFFPRMYTRGEARHLTKEELALLYDSCLRPAIATVVPSSLSHWPVSYQACLMAMKDKRNQFHPTRRDIPSHRLDQLCTELRNNLDQYTYFKDSFFVHEWRGLKGATCHDPEDPDQCDEAFQAAFSMLRTDELLGPHGDNEWYIDVALEVYSPGLVLQWRTDSHEQLLQYGLPSAPPHRITTAVNGSHFKKDVSSLLYQLSGFRVEVPSVGAADFVRYANVYTTDKSATYQLHQGTFRRHRAEDLLPDRLESFLNDVAELAKLYDICAGLRGVQHEGAARYEVRMKVVPGRIAHKLRTMPRDLINAAVVGFDPYDWW